MGLTSESAFARNATAVVLEVTAIARNERLKAYAILRRSSLYLIKLRYPD